MAENVSPERRNCDGRLLDDQEKGVLNTEARPGTDRATPIVGPKYTKKKSCYSTAEATHPDSFLNILDATSSNLVFWGPPQDERFFIPIALPGERAKKAVSAAPPAIHVPSQTARRGGREVEGGGLLIHSALFVLAPFHLF
jgi:hypothetical protein